MIQWLFQPTPSSSLYPLFNPQVVRAPPVDRRGQERVIRVLPTFPSTASMQNDLGFGEERERITVVLARDGVSHGENIYIYQQTHATTGDYPPTTRLSLFHGWNVVHGWRAIEGGGLERCDSEAFCEKDASRRASVSVPVPS